MSVAGCRLGLLHDASPIGMLRWAMTSLVSCLCYIFDRTARKQWTFQIFVGPSSFIRIDIITIYI